MASTLHFRKNWESPTEGCLDQKGPYTGLRVQLGVKLHAIPSASKKVRWALRVNLWKAGHGDTYLGG